MREGIYITGSAGLVGSRYVELNSSKYNLLTPEIGELNILNRDSLDEYFGKQKINVVVHFAAFTDVGGAENQRGDKNGSCWRINVEGTRNLAEMCRKYNVFMIHVSTDMVFPGSKENPGPYFETDRPETNSKRLTWYGFTKAEGERAVKRILGNEATIVRIIYPVRAQYAGKLDYLRKPVALFDQGKLYPLYMDQQISITFIDEFSRALEKIIEGEIFGTFHVCSKDTTTPYEIISYLVEKVRGKTNVIQKASLPEGNIRYQKYGGLAVAETEKRLGINFSTCKQIVDELVRQGIG